MFHWIKLVEKSASKLIIDESVKNYLKKSDKIVQYLSKNKYANLQIFSKLFYYNFIKYDCLRLVSPDFDLKKNIPHYRSYAKPFSITGFHSKLL